MLVFSLKNALKAANNEIEFNKKIAKLVYKHFSGKFFFWSRILNIYKYIKKTILDYFTTGKKKLFVFSLEKYLKSCD